VSGPATIVTAPVLAGTVLVGCGGGSTRTVTVRAGTTSTPALPTIPANRRPPRSICTTWSHRRSRARPAQSARRRSGLPSSRSKSAPRCCRWRCTTPHQGDHGQRRRAVRIRQGDAHRAGAADDREPCATDSPPARDHPPPRRIHRLDRHPRPTNQGCHGARAAAVAAALQHDLGTGAPAILARGHGTRAEPPGHDRLPGDVVTAMSAGHCVRCVQGCRGPGAAQGSPGAASAASDAQTKLNAIAAPSSLTGTRVASLTAASE